MTILIIVLIFTSFLITLFSTILIKNLALKKSFVDMPGARKIHTKPIPLGGGVALAMGIILPILMGIFCAYLHQKYSLFSFISENILIHIPGIFQRLDNLFVLLCGGLVILILGLVDDKVELSPLTKLVVQVIVALGIVLSGQQLSLFLGGDVGKIIGAIITILWIVIVTNSFNLLDHMDGLCSGVCLLVSIAFLLVALQNNLIFIASIFSVLIGSTLAFLLFNFHPAKIFLGDAGSLFLGYLLATLTMAFTFYKPIYHLYSYFVPIVILSVPLFDTLIVVLIRLKTKKNIFAPDQNHFAHRLLALGVAPKTTIIIVYAITSCGGLYGVLLYQVDILGAFIILTELILILLLITTLELSVKTSSNK
jgi:UDP-GlcNAc:undecaprenyl-phosphate GlcNAc-1-phosphate transferase